MPNVLVIGSSNTDLVVRTPRLPNPGETLLGGVFFSAAGGKGANQAVAAARAGAEVTFIARTGQDDFGRQSIEGFQREKIDTSYILTDPDHPSGVAFILVDEAGENSIVVAPGANGVLSPVQLDAAEAAFKRADICLLQLETPIDTVAYAAEMAAQNGLKVILNPAPAAQLPDAIWQTLFLITPNETETALLTGIAPETDDDAKRAGEALLKKGAQNAAITLGARGAILIAESGFEHMPAPQADVVDTTAAGDAFNGALACELSRGAPLNSSVYFGCAAGALTVSKPGAQPALPTRADILQLLDKT